MIIRPVSKNDHAALLVLAERAGYGMTSLPQDEAVLAQKIETSELSFANTPATPNEHRFLLVMEDETTGEVVGSSGIKAHIGLSNPFYSYKLSTLVQASADPKAYFKHEVLHMVNDYTGMSEIGSLFLRESYRRDGLGRFLSRCRYLMLAEFPDLFADTVIAEMRGVHDEQGHSPFYANLAKHFFGIPFREADYVNATKGGQFIADLMPKYPIYVNLLPEKARAVIGEVNPASKPAVLMLEREGFRYSGYLDIFDGGPTVEAERTRIRTVRKSRNLPVKAIVDSLPDEAAKMMAMTTHLASLRMVCEPMLATEEGITLSRRAAKNLQIALGESLRICEA